MSGMRARICLAAMLVLALVGARASHSGVLWVLLVSSSSTGAPSLGGHSEIATVSADGRFVVFESFSPTLVPGDVHGASDIFIRDCVFGNTELISVNLPNTVPFSGSHSPSVNADGRFVTFESHDSNLVDGDTNASSDIFLRDRHRNITERISVSSTGTEGNGNSSFASISADGRFVGFNSSASNLVPGDTNNATDVFVRDRLLGTTERVSVDAAGAELTIGAVNGTISADGRIVAFATFDSNLVPGDNNNANDVFVRDRLTGTVERVSIGPGGLQGIFSASISRLNANGRFVAFTTQGALLPEDTNNRIDVYVRDRVFGTLERANVGPAGVQANNTSTSSGPTLSADGRFVSFASNAVNLVPNDTNGPDIFVRDRWFGSTQRVSLDNNGGQVIASMSNATISGDGGHVAFEASDTTFVPDDTDGWEDVFLVRRSPDAANRAPVANGGRDLLFTVPHDGSAGSAAAAFSIDAGIGSYDPEGLPIFYRWLETDGTELSRVRTVSGSRPVGKHTLVLEVMDACGAKSTDRISILVQPEPNQAPIANAGADQSVQVAHDGNPATQTVMVTLSAANSQDPESDALTYQWKDAAGAVLGTSITLPRTLAPGSHTFRLRVTDPYGAYSEDSVSVLVLAEPNRTPLADPGPGQEVRIARDGGTQAAVTLDGSRSLDPDGDALTYLWINAAGTQLGTTAMLNQNLAAGKHSFRLRVTDPYGAFDEESVSIHVLTVTNRAPRANAGPDQQVRVPHDADPAESAVQVSLNGGSSSDPDGDTLSYEWRNAAGNVVATTATTNQSLKVGRYTFRLRVSDPFGESSEDRVSVEVLAELNRSPVANAGADQSLSETGDTRDVLLSSAASTDPDGDTLTYEWREDGAVLATTASPTVTLEPGRHRIELQVTDPYGLSATDTVTVYIGVVDVTSLVTIRKLRPTAGKVRGESVVRVRVTNGTDGTLPAPVSLVLDGMVATKVVNKTGLTTAATGTAGKAYLDRVAIAPGATGEFSVRVKLGRVSALPGPFRVLVGIGAR